MVDWGVGRRIISRGGSLFARTVLGLEPRDLTGGFKAWRAETLAAVPFDGVHAGGYVFQIEMTFRAARAGARIRELPITFRDRRVGQSKMSRRIVAEALVVVVQLRAEELRDRAAPRVGARDRRPGAPARDGGRAGRRPASGSCSTSRPLQTPERAPLTATYLDGLLRAFDAEPIAGESFALFLRSDLDDPTARYGHLEVVGRRLLPPTRLLRSAAMTVDPFLLRGATPGRSLARRARRGGRRRLPRRRGRLAADRARACRSW